MTSRPGLLLSLIFTAFFLFPAIHSCRLRSGRQQNVKLANGTEEGYILAKKYCSTCHSFVDAENLNQATWRDRVLPGMAPKLGIGVFGETDYVNNGNQQPGAFSFEAWMKIVRYYTKNSPVMLSPAIPPVLPSRDWSVFTLRRPLYSIFPFAKTMLVSVDTATKNLYTSDGNTRYAYRWNNLQAGDSVYLSSPAVAAGFFNSKNGDRQVVFSTLGTMLPTDIAEGMLLQFNATENLSATDTLINGLPRPVQICSADINKDGLSDWVVCGFGHTKGGLYWLEHQPKGNYKKRVILELPGAIKAIPRDFNKDGFTDLMVLFAHDDECIRLFMNDQKGSFTMSKILSFPPVYGSSGFQLADFDQDGLEDILYTCGDNADLSPVLKPFHGLYIYLNKKDSGFQQSYFYPINGCTKAIAADFDKDGDLDIATIAFFADLKNNPAEKFLYFEQKKSMHFSVHSPPIETNGRWICMDVADYDKDGDADIILGNFAKGFTGAKDNRTDWDVSTPFIVLENKVNR